MADCWSCGHDLGPLRAVEREELCSKCETWIHCCKNCRFWDDSARTCEEPAAEWVHDRERANFCEFFAMRSEDVESRRRRDDDDDGDASGRAAFEALFKS